MTYILLVQRGMSLKREHYPEIPIFGLIVVTLVFIVAIYCFIKYFGKDDN